MSRVAVDPVVLRSRETIRKGSTSFAGAARLLAPDTRESVHLLYSWCRHCDDVIDGQDLGRSRPVDAKAAGPARLESLERDTRSALSGEKPLHPAFVGLQRVIERHRIPHLHPLDLLHGFAMDVEGRYHRTVEQTARYCYHVAGVVGVMMAYVMDATGHGALQRAADLGIALQMTNIARDVMDDAAAGRIYLPLDWLEEAGVPADQIGSRGHRAAVHGVTRRLLNEADRYYRSSTAGLCSLSLRSAWAVAAARGIYRQIGRRVLARGESAWDRRVVVGRPLKLWRLALAAGEAFGAVVLRHGQDLPRDGLWTRQPAGDLDAGR